MEREVRRLIRSRFYVRHTASKDSPAATCLLRSCVDPSHRGGDELRKLATHFGVIEQQNR